MRKYLLAGALALAFAGGVAVSQQLSFTSLTGNEVLTAELGGPGGTGIFVPVSELRNAQGVQLTALTTGALTIPVTTATLITTAVVSGALAVTAPPVPWDGQIFEIANGSGSANTATVTFTANTGQTVNGGAVATQASQGSAEWRYVQSTTTWYRLR
jgi:predicted outer membrane repeat protein